jgi:hypothetical protein
MRILCNLEILAIPFVNTDILCFKKTVFFRNTPDPECRCQRQGREKD